MLFISSKNFTDLNSFTCHDKGSWSANLRILIGIKSLHIPFKECH
jgi:hypothetical protein